MAIIVDIAHMRREYHRLVKCIDEEGGRQVRMCPLGLWVVDGPDAETADTEAWRYFVQYYQDGEYS
jgi:hypothetical protein